MRAWVRAHRWLCGLFAAVLLFGQTAAVVHACQRMILTAPGGGLAAAVAAADAMAPCSGHAEADPAPGPALLCKAHCQADQQSVNSAPALADLPSPLLLGPVPWHWPDPAALPARGQPARSALPVGPPAGTPPLYLSLLVLRN